MCIEETFGSIVSVSDRNQNVVARFRNPKKLRYRKVKVDGCIVTVGRRADWIVSEVGVASVIVEIKGKDIVSACEQLMASLNDSNCIALLESRVGLLIMCTRVPSGDTKAQKLIAEIRSKGLKLKIYTGSREFDLISLA